MNDKREPEGSGVTCPQHSGHESTLEDHEGRLDKIDNQILDLRNNVRPWIAMVLSGSTFLIGCLVTFIGMTIGQGGM